MAISVIGVDFRTAPVSVREHIALGRDQVLQLLHVIREEKIFDEAMILSTCNRTEFYFAVDAAKRAAAVEHLLLHAAELAGGPPAERSLFFSYDGDQAVRRLFSVAASLQSQVVGEHEIMGQMKEAYHVACEARTVGFVFHKLLHWAFRAGKRVMTQTRLGQGTASVAKAAVDLAGQIFTDLSGKTVLLVGAGQTAELSAQALIRAGVTRLVIANRTVARAQQLADGFVQWRSSTTDKPDRQGPEMTAGGEFTCPALANYLATCQLRPGNEDTAANAAAVAPLPGQAGKPSAPPLDVRAVGLDAIPSVIGQVDLVISSTGATEPVLTYDALHGVLGRSGRSVLLIDIAVPRDIDERLGKLSNVFLYNIDGLEAIVARNIDRRKLEVPRAEALVADEVEQFGHWLSSLEVVPTIKLLQQRLWELQQAHVERYKRKFSAADREKLDEFARGLCDKILHPPIAFLRQLSSQQGGGDMSAIDTLRRIFDLDSTKDKE
jgi:glutamyl-tRNA reductase